MICWELMIIRKVSQTHFNNGRHDLETKSFLKHDLVHFAVDKVLFIYNDADPNTHTLELEQLAGLLHSVYDETITNERILEGAANLWGAYGKSVPPFLTYEFINRVRDMANELLDRYTHLKTGESMELM
jgi:hypothetical protein